MDDLSLAGDFPAAPEAEWLGLVNKALGNAPFDSLRTLLHEGFKTEPLYTRAALSPPLFGSRGWHAVQPLTADAAQLNDDLANGAGALSIDFRSGFAVRTRSELKNLLGSDVPYYLAPGSLAADAAFILAASDKPAIAGSAGFDPLTGIAISGEAPTEKWAHLADYVDAAFHIREHFPLFIPFLAGGHVWDGAGGSATQELAFTLAAATAYWRALSEAGMPHPEAVRCIGFSLSASADIFLTIAKFRSLRLLWAHAVEAADEKPPADTLLLAKMSHRIVSAYDSHVNLLRGTAAAFGAAIGGAFGIEVLPYDSVSGGQTPLSRRLARNTSLILQEESYLSAVADAAAGSAYVETLTTELSSKAWALFQRVEAQGGLGAAIESGFIQGELQLKAQERERAVAYRRDKITGVSVFPNLYENTAASEPQPRPAVEGSASGAEGLPILPAPGKGERFVALLAAACGDVPLSGLRMAMRRVPAIVAPPLAVSNRDAEPFETLRRRADAALELIGARPPIFLALLGEPAGYRARASWVQGFFAAGGIETIVPEQAFGSVGSLAAAFKESPAPAACLCASNGAYASMPGAAAALKRAGAVAVYLAGPPSVLKTLDQADAMAISRLIYEGCNVLGILEEAQAALHVEELSAAAANEEAEGSFPARVPRAGRDLG